MILYRAAKNTLAFSLVNRRHLHREIRDMLPVLVLVKCSDVSPLLHSLDGLSLCMCRVHSFDPMSALSENQAGEAPSIRSHFMCMSVVLILH